jgi:hypothetical protein
MTRITSFGDSTSLVVSDSVPDSLAIDSNNNNAPLKFVVDRMEEAEKKDKAKDKDERKLWNVCTYVVLSHFALITPSLSFPPNQRLVGAGDPPSTIVKFHIPRTLFDIDPITVKRECRFISTRFVSYSCSSGAQ